MIRLLAADIDNRVLLRNIIQKKHGRNQRRCDACETQNTAVCDTCDNYDNHALMEAIEPYVLERYDFYEANITNLNLITETHMITGHTKDLLIDSYEKSSDFANARKDIFDSMPDAIKAKCPFCMISNPHTLDHYFDKDIYPEFAVYTPNLIPCCSECNSKKGTNIFLPNGERKALHYYFDEIPDYQFLFMTVVLDDRIPYVNITLRLDENNEVDRIVNNQFASLDLIDRYRNQLNDQLSTTIAELREYYHQNYDIQIVINILNTKVRAYRMNNGVNYWLACLYDGLTTDPNMLERILQEAQ